MDLRAYRVILHVGFVGGKIKSNGELKEFEAQGDVEVSYPPRSIKYFGWVYLLQTGIPGVLVIILAFIRVYLAQRLKLE